MYYIWLLILLYFSYFNYILFVGSDYFSQIHSVGLLLRCLIPDNSNKIESFHEEYGLLINTVPSKICHTIALPLQNNKKFLIISRILPYEQQWSTKTYDYERNIWYQYDLLYFVGKTNSSNWWITFTKNTIHR